MNDHQLTHALIVALKNARTALTACAEHLPDNSDADILCPASMREITKVLDAWEMEYGEAQNAL